MQTQNLGQQNRASTDSQTNVVSLYEFRKDKASAEFFARGRKPLYVSHARGQIQGQASAASDRKAISSDFVSQLNRLKQGLAQVEALLQS